MNREVPPPTSTFRILSPSWSKFSTPTRKNLMKWSGEAQALGIQISPTLGTSLLSSNLETTTLRNVRSEEEPTLEMCNVVPFSNSIMNFDPYLCLHVKPAVINFDSKISNMCLSWIYPHTVHHTKSLQMPYQSSYSWILFYAWVVKPTDDILLKQFLCNQILIMLSNT